MKKNIVVLIALFAQVPIFISCADQEHPTTPSSLSKERKAADACLEASGCHSPEVDEADVMSDELTKLNCAAKALSITPIAEKITASEIKKFKKELTALTKPLICAGAQPHFLDAQNNDAPHIFTVDLFADYAQTLPCSQAITNYFRNTRMSLFKQCSDTLTKLYKSYSQKISDPSLGLSKIECQIALLNAWGYVGANDLDGFIIFLQKEGYDQLLSTPGSEAINRSSRTPSITFSPVAFVGEYCLNHCELNEMHAPRLDADEEKAERERLYKSGRWQEHLDKEESQPDQDQPKQQNIFHKNWELKIAKNGFPAKEFCEKHSPNYRKISVRTITLPIADVRKSSPTEDPFESF